MNKRPKRTIIKKKLEFNEGLHWQEERDLRKALYASLQASSERDEEEGEDELDEDTNDAATNSIGEYEESSTESSVYHEDTSATSEQSSSADMEKHTLARSDIRVLRKRIKKDREKNKVKKKHKAKKRPIKRGYTRAIYAAVQQNPLELELMQLNSKKTNITVQRKFAVSYSPSPSPAKPSPATTPTPRIKAEIFTNNFEAVPTILSFTPKTEDFLTFLCLRESPALPKHLDLFRRSKERIHKKAQLAMEEEIKELVRPDRLKNKARILVQKAKANALHNIKNPGVRRPWRECKAMRMRESVRKALPSAGAPSDASANPLSPPYLLPVPPQMDTPPEHHHPPSLIPIMPLKSAKHKPHRLRMRRRQLDINGSIQSKENGHKMKTKHTYAAKENQRMLYKRKLRSMDSQFCEKPSRDITLKKKREERLKGRTTEKIKYKSGLLRLRMRRQSQSINGITEAFDSEGNTNAAYSNQIRTKKKKSHKVNGAIKNERVTRSSILRANGRNTYLNGHKKRSKADLSSESIVRKLRSFHISKEKNEEECGNKSRSEGSEQDLTPRRSKRKRTPRFDMDCLLAEEINPKLDVDSTILVSCQCCRSMDNENPKRRRRKEDKEWDYPHKSDHSLRKDANMFEESFCDVASQAGMIKVNDTVCRAKISRNVKVFLKEDKIEELLERKRKMKTRSSPRNIEQYSEPGESSAAGSETAFDSLDTTTTDSLTALKVDKESKLFSDSNSMISKYKNGEKEIKRKQKEDILRSKRIITPTLKSLESLENLDDLVSPENGENHIMYPSPKKKDPEFIPHIKSKQPHSVYNNNKKKLIGHPLRKKLEKSLSCTHRSTSGLVKDRTKGPIQNSPTLQREITSLEDPFSTTSTNNSSSVSDVPTFHLTPSEWENLASFLERKASIIEAAGMCKIVPPEGTQLSTTAFDNLQNLRFTPEVQYIHRLNLRWSSASKRLACLKRYVEKRENVAFQSPQISGCELDLLKFAELINHEGGFQAVQSRKKWPKVADQLNIPRHVQGRTTKLESICGKYLVAFSKLSQSDKELILKEVEAERNQKLNGQADVSPMKVNESEVKRIGHVTNLEQFKQRAAVLNEMIRAGEDNTPADVEKDYWRIVNEADRYIAVQRAEVGLAVADRNSNCISGVWEDSENLLSMLPSSIQQRMFKLKFGTVYSTEPWRVNHQAMVGVEYLHSGNPKIWYSIPESQTQALEMVLQNHAAEIKTKRHSCLHDQSFIYMLPPSLLQDRGGVGTVYKAIQNPGEIIVQWYGAATSSISCGFHISQCFPYATSHWLQRGMQAFQISKKLYQSIPFSFEHLLHVLIQHILQGKRASQGLVERILPVFRENRKHELFLRKKLQNSGARLMALADRISVNGPSRISPGRGSPSRASPGRGSPARGSRSPGRSGPKNEDQFPQCNSCNQFCYFSVVMNEREDRVFCLQHASEYFTIGKNCHGWTVYYRLAEEKMEDIIKVLSQATQSRPLSAVQTMSLRQQTPFSRSQTPSSRPLAKSKLSTPSSKPQSFLTILQSESPSVPSVETSSPKMQLTASKEPTLTSQEPVIASSREQMVTSEVQTPLSRTASSKVQKALSKMQTTPSKAQTTPSKVQTTLSKVQTTPSRVQTTPSKLQTTPSKVQTTPSKLQTTPSKLQTAPSKVQTTPSKVQTTPSKVQTTPSKVQTTPFKVQTTPSKVKTSPLKVQTTPSKVQTTPSKLQTTPSMLQTTPSKVQTTPSKVQTTPFKVQTTPCKVQTISSKVQTISSKVQTTPSKVKTTPSKVKTTPSKVKTSPPKVQITPSKLQTTPSKLQTTPSFKVQTTPSKVQTAPSKVQSTSSKVQTTPSKVQTTPSKVQTTPSKVQSTSSKAQTTTSKVQTTSSKAQTTPSKVQTTPFKMQTTPSKVQTTPSKVQTSPPKVQTTPCKVQTAPPKVPTASSKVETVSAKLQTASSKLNSACSKVPTASTKAPSVYARSHILPKAQITTGRLQTGSCRSQAVSSRVHTASSRVQTASSRIQTASSVTSLTTSDMLISVALHCPPTNAQAVVSSAI